MKDPQDEKKRPGRNKDPEEHIFDNILLPATILSVRLDEEHCQCNSRSSHAKLLEKLGGDEGLK